MELLLSSIMQFLEHTFGYDTAFKIKDSFDFSDGVILGALIMLWLMGKFFMDVSRDSKLPEDIAIMWVEKEGILGLVANPKNVFEAVEVFIGYLILKIFRQRGLRLKRLRLITAIILIITLVIFFLGMIDSMYPYFPHDGHPFP
ncbi:hypothetical protein [Desulfosporosinus sp. FKB]|uniref:hypothetical protein n=1 Tax=Desulfosporosinus sp. FKB TaxID=1969835 RepID=UPI000B4974A1|nr:hypothetical protein [Desulfosporosinus sp. FKB]